MAHIAVFPGSFDPITTGHVDILERAKPLFDRIIVAIGVNTQKNYLFPLEQRMEWIDRVFADHDRIEVASYTGLTIHFCEQVGASHIIRGIRSAADFEYEKTIAHLNTAMATDLETILILSRPELSSISSTIVREIIRGKGDVSRFVPDAIVEDIRAFGKTIQ